MKLSISSDFPEQLKIYLQSQEAYYHHCMMVRDYKRAYILAGQLGKYIEKSLPHEWQMHLEARISALHCLLIAGPQIDPSLYALKILAMTHNLYQDFIINTSYSNVPYEGWISRRWAAVVNDWQNSRAIDELLASFAGRTDMPSRLRVEAETALRAVKREIEWNQKVSSPNDEWEPAAAIGSSAQLFSKFSILGVLGMAHRKCQLKQQKAESAQELQQDDEISSQMARVAIRETDAASDSPASRLSCRGA